MRRALIAHILLLVFGIQALLGGSGAVVVCLGGGHEHGPTEAAHCESACTHDSSWPIPIPADDHDDDCGCTDVEFEISELPTLPRVDLGAPEVIVVASTSDYGPLFVKSGLGREPPLPPPPWFDPSGVQRIKLLSSFVLTI